ncbi:MAG: TspO/MBR family protein [Candidatus Woesearchaeota archaeon]
MKKKPRVARIARFIISILIPLIIGFLGSIFTSKSVNSWYLALNKPFFNPPNWLFAPVWIILFVLIGISFYFAWDKNFGGNKKIRKAVCLTVYSLQLFFNFLWSLLFFGLKNPLFAFAEIIFLWFLIIANIFVFYKVSKISAYLLVPYLLWVSFASLLNCYITILN